MAYPNRQFQSDLTILITPCGLNCARCRFHLRERKPCPGCRSIDPRDKSSACANCKIRNCPKFAEGGYDFCSACPDYPCVDMKRLIKRYQTKYAVSIPENMLRIQAVGVEQFAIEDRAHWSCPHCGELLCMHHPECIYCGHSWRIS